MGHTQTSKEVELAEKQVLSGKKRGTRESKRVSLIKNAFCIFCGIVIKLKANNIKEWMIKK